MFSGNTGIRIDWAYITKYALRAARRRASLDALLHSLDALATSLASARGALLQRGGQQPRATHSDSRSLHRDQQGLRPYRVLVFCLQPSHTRQAVLCIET